MHDTAMRKHPAPRLNAADLDGQTLYQRIRRRIFAHKALNLFMCVDHRRMITVKESADRRPRYIRQLMAEIHRHLPRKCNIVAALG